MLYVYESFNEINYLLCQLIKGFYRVRLWNYLCVYEQMYKESIVYIVIVVVLGYKKE